MKRNYSSGTTDAVRFFTGIEIERTPAYGMPTLFIVGLHSILEIEDILNNNKDIAHIFFGANHSYNPSNNEFDVWESTITHFIEKGYLCSLDIPLSYAEEFHEGGLCSYGTFIPQIRIPLPYMQLWNYNTMIKLDDKGFNKTNPGVWCHNLHDLKNRDKFTPWHEYKNDKIIK